MKKTVLSAVALAVGLGVAASAAQAADRIGVTIYKYDDNFMSLMRKEINKEAEQFKDIELLMNDSQNAQAVQNDQVDGLISKGVKALAINLVDPAAAPTIIGKAKPDDIPVVFFNKDPGAKAIGSYEHAYYVGTDPKESGLIQGSLIAKHWQANPAYDLNKDGKIQYVLLGEIAGTVLNDGVNQGKAVVQLSNNLAKGKPATEGTKWQLKDRVVRIPYVGVDADNLNEFLK
ncbi:substrate-binding domain-containing protein [Pasteurella multocida]|uniref:substrate-binding domain-containing protein n=1 Tax=Pasteurella multocida TaxID=747 RepID=UPI000C184ADF|nr:substrate-binding domain-containing protein [Pasteurella multocida]